MGLVSTALNTASGVLADQWKEYFYCDALTNDVLVAKGHRRKNGWGSNNGNDNIITAGSVVAVADGQCMMIVEQGKIVDVCSEAGEYVYDSSTEPSLLCGNLSETIQKVFEQIGKRFNFGGIAPKDQRVYYFNTKEITGNKYGTPAPIPFRVVDTRASIDVDISISCFGEYSYKMVNPLLFYANVCGNVADVYSRSEIDSQLKSELLTALQPVFAKISEIGVRYSALPGHTAELSQAMKDELSKKWGEQRGLEIVQMGVSAVKASEDDEQMIKDMQKSASLKDPATAAAYLAGAQGEAMQHAAKNENGAAMGFMGMNLAGNGMSLSDLFHLGQKDQTPTNAWKCTCGATATGKFCAQCGKARPVDTEGWTCSCGTVNRGKYCTECGKQKPADAIQYRCDKCGWEAPANEDPPKFCPECGDPFDDSDRV